MSKTTTQPTALEIIVTVEGGVVQHVAVPPGVRVIVRDYDTEGIVDEEKLDLKEDEDGELYIENVWDCTYKNPCATVVTPIAATLEAPKPCPLCGVPTRGVAGFIVPLCPPCRESEQAALDERLKAISIVSDFSASAFTLAEGGAD